MHIVHHGMVEGVRRPLTMFPRSGSRERNVSIQSRPPAQVVVTPTLRVCLPSSIKPSRKQTQSTPRVCLLCVSKSRQLEDGDQPSQSVFRVLQGFGESAQ